jgi:hypothetical protein
VDGRRRAGEDVEKIQDLGIPGELEMSVGKELRLNLHELEEGEYRPLERCKGMDLEEADSLRVDLVAYFYRDDRS